jgi:serine/threonine-protein phosphatase CPPED1
VGDIAGVVLNSNLEKGAEKVPEEAAKMEAWFRGELERVKLAGATHIIVFQHIPFFLKTADEADGYFNIPKPVRERYLRLLHEYGVQQVFAGHLHHNELGRDGDLEMVTTGPVGMPLEGGKSGLRVVTVKDGKVTHNFYDFGELP